MSSYIPLPRATSTRLVCLQPSPTLDTPVDVSLLTIDLAASDRSQTYEAVSYTCGSKNDPAEIQVNGKPVSIRRNLYQGLVRLRQQTTVRYLWVDAISISQVNLDEKAAQVQMIGNVFSLADRVLIWLGEHADGSQELFCGWQCFDDRHRTLDPISATDREEINRRMLIWIAFLSRPYWYRTWIVQEVALARHVVIHCGKTLVNWEDMIGIRLQEEYAGTECTTALVIDGLPTNFTASRIVPEGDPGFFELATPFHNRVLHVRNIDRLCTYRYTRKKENIMEFLQKLLGFECEDRLDRIYGVLSLEDATEVGYPEIKVDYTLSLPELVLEMLAKRYVFRPERSVIDSVAEQDQKTYVPRVIHALQLTLEELRELKALCVAELQHERLDGYPLFANRWLKVYRSLVRLAGTVHVPI